MKRDVSIITDAPQSPDAQLRHRKVTYVLMMAMRIVFLVVAAIVVAADVPYALWWVVLCIAGMMLFPWIAVLIANDRAPRRPSMLGRIVRGRRASQKVLSKPHHQATPPSINHLVD